MSSEESLSRLLDREITGQELHDYQEFKRNVETTGNLIDSGLTEDSVRLLKELEEICVVDPLEVRYKLMTSHDLRDALRVVKDFKVVGRTTNAVYSNYRNIVKNYVRSQSFPVEDQPDLVNHPQGEATFMSQGNPDFPDHESGGTAVPNESDEGERRRKFKERFIHSQLRSDGDDYPSLNRAINAALRDDKK